MRTDPADNGGLFIGRLPGTAPVRYRGAAQRRLGLRLTFDKAFAAAILGVMGLVASTFWGPIPAAWLWVGAQVKQMTGSGGLVFAIAAVVGVALFVSWFVRFAGPGPELFGGRR